MLSPVAVLDIGSHSCRISIFKIEQNQPVLWERKKIATRLSADMPKKNTLSEERMNQAVSAISSLLELAEKFSCQCILTSATAAVRNADNQEKFLQKVKEATTIDLRVLSGEEEAHIGFLSVSRSLLLSDYLLVDTGGASVEISFIKQNKRKASVSLPLGAVIMTEQFLERDSVSADHLFSFFRHLNNTIGALPFLQEAKGLPLVVLGGPNKCFAKLKDSINPIHGVCLSCEEVFSLFSSLLQKNLKERQEMFAPFGESDRGDIIIAGMAPVVYLLMHTQGPSITICDHGLEYGLVYEAMDREKSL